MCPQAVCLVQKACEEAGIACTIISILDEINEKLQIPRYYKVPFKMGYPLGEANNFEQQKSICKEALTLLKFKD